MSDTQPRSSGTETCCPSPTERRAPLESVLEAVRFAFQERIVAVVCLALGVCALVGWVSGLRLLSSFSLVGAVVDMESSLALLFLGGGLLASSRCWPRTARAAEYAVLALALLGFIRAVSGALSGPVLPSVPSPSGGDGAVMSASAALGFWLAAVGLVLRRSGRAGQGAVLGTAASLLAIGCIAVVAAFLGTMTAFGFAALGDIPLSVAIGFCCLSSFLLFEDRGAREKEAAFANAYFAATLASMAAAAVLLAALHAQAEEAQRAWQTAVGRAAQEERSGVPAVRTESWSDARQKELASLQTRAEALRGQSAVLQVLAPLFGVFLAVGAFVLWRGLRRRFAWMEREFAERVKERTKDLEATIIQLDGLNRRLVESERAAVAREAQVQHVLASSPVVLWAVDRNGVYTYRQGGGLATLGQGAGHGVGRRESDVRCENPQFAQNFQRAMKGEVFSAEYSVQGRWFRTRYAPLKNEQGECIGVVGISSDVTERREADQKALSEESARQASRLKSEFLASMSHEIRTPMNGIVGMAGLLSQTPLSDEQQGMLDVIQNSADALLSAVNDILDLSRLEAGKLALEEASFDFRAMVEDVLSLRSPKAYEKGLELINDWGSTLPDLVVGDEGRIRQVLDNLVGNAVKFTKSGHVLVRVRKVGQKERRIGMRIEIIDTGVGLSQEAREKLLAPFKATDRNKARRVGDSGLGLAIARQLVELMGGRLGIESEVGVGSTFWFEWELPCASEGEEGAGPTLPAGTRVLVLDDNELCRGILALRLGARGALVDVASDCGRAFDQCRAMAADKKPYAALVVDRFLVKGDAVQFAKGIRASGSLADTPIVLLSPDGASRDASVDGLFQAIEAKPVREYRLVKAIGSCLGRRRPAVVVGAGAGVGGVARPAGPLKVLVVEDNLLNQRVTKTMAEKLGHKVEVANDGVEALKRIEEGGYDVVLMDCQMPNMDGYEATRRVRSSDKPWGGLRIIAVTANATTADRKLCFDSGMDDFITKPLRAADLEAALSRQGAGEAPVSG